MRTAIGLVLLFSATASAASRSAAFREVSLEARCPALAAEVQSLSEAKLGRGRYQALGCAEGNGLGGARYSLDFKLSKDSGTWRRFRIDAAYDDQDAPLVRLCDTGRTPPDCSHGASKAFEEMGTGAKQVLTALEAWLAAKATSKMIFGKPYAAFVEEVVAEGRDYPIKGAATAGKVRLKLTSRASGQPESGRVTALGDVAPEFLACFHCKTSACLSDEVRYQFEDRFFSLVREDKQSGKTFGAGWIIEGQDVASWSYVCGVSRYSLQSVKK